MSKKINQLILIIIILLVTSNFQLAHATSGGKSDIFRKWRDGFNSFFHKDRDWNEHEDRDGRHDDRDEHGCKTEKNGKRKCKAHEVPEYPVYGMGIVSLGALGIYAYYSKKTQNA